MTLAPTASPKASRGELPDRWRFDLHHHYVSPLWLAALTDQRTKLVFPGYETFKRWAPSAAIEAMDKGGVACSVLSTTTPGIWFGDRTQTKQLARDMNEYGASLAAEYKGRFGLFAVLPLPSVDDSLAEIEYALDVLHADGISVLSSYGTKWLGDADFAPIWSELNRRKAVVYSHATAPDCCRGLMPGLDPTTIEFNTDTSRTIVSLIESGTVARNPDIRFVFSHAGGTMPALAGRYLRAEASARSLAAEAPMNSRLWHLRRFFYDTAGSANPVQMTALKMIVSSAQIVFGTDFPWSTPQQIAAGLAGCGFSEDELVGISRDNALRALTGEHVA